MDSERILEIVKSNRDNEIYLLGQLMLDEFGITSIILGSLFPNTEIYSAEIVMPTHDKSNIIEKVNNYIATLEQMQRANLISKVSTMDLDSIGPKEFLADWVRNPVIDNPYYTGRSYHLSKSQWELLCSHFTA